MQRTSHARLSSPVGLASAPAPMRADENSLARQQGQDERPPSQPFISHANISSGHYLRHQPDRRQAAMWQTYSRNCEMNWRRTCTRRISSCPTTCTTHRRPYYRDGGCQWSATCFVMSTDRVRNPNKGSERSEQAFTLAPCSCRDSEACLPTQKKTASSLWPTQSSVTTVQMQTNTSIESREATVGGT